MRMSTKIWLIIAIVSNVALWFFFQPIIDAISFGTGGLSVAFGWQAYLGIVLFAISCVSGTIIFSRFIKSQPLNRQIFFSTIPPTATFVFLMLFFFTITIRQQTDIVTAIRVGLGITTLSASYIWMVVIVLIYSIYMYITYTSLSRPVKKIERAVEILRNGKAKKPIEVGKGKQFEGIEEDLNQINENYKQQEKILKNLVANEENKKEENLEKKLEKTLEKNDKNRQRLNEIKAEKEIEEKTSEKTNKKLKKKELKIKEKAQNPH